jgi:hypothetical protein
MTIQAMVICKYIGNVNGITQVYNTLGNSDKLDSKNNTNFITHLEIHVYK